MHSFIHQYVLSTFKKHNLVAAQISGMSSHFGITADLDSNPDPINS